jgi:hypothetical protein
MEKWTRYDYVCTTCDALIEYIMQRTEIPLDVDMYTYKCVCGGNGVLMSEVDATISPNLEKEEHKMETTEYLKAQVDILQKNLSNHTNCDYWKAENGRVQSQIIDVVDEIYAGNWSDVEDIASTLSEIIDYNPVKEIEFTATIRFTGRMEIPSAEYNSGGYNLSDILGDAYVDINNGDIVIDGYEIEDAEEC